MTPTSPLAPIPDYIAPEWVHDFDIYSAELDDGDYHQALVRLHKAEVPDIFWTPRNGGHWVATRSAIMDEIFKNPELFSSRKWNIPVERNFPIPNVPLNLDPPEHAKYRALIASSLAPNAVGGLGEGARILAIELIDGFKQQGQCEFVHDFALHLPIAIFMKIVDLPSADREMLLDLVEPQFRPENEERRLVCLQKTIEYVMQKIAERRANPGTDLISSLTQAKVDGELVSDEKLIGMVMLLLGGGLDTVASMLGFFALFLARNPAHRKQLIEQPELIPVAVEEMVRRHSIVTPGRIATKDFEFKGVQIREGNMVALMTALYSLDERKFENPLKVDFSRKIIIHGAFGNGIHRCPGSLLARTELRIFLEEWLKRIPDFSVKEGDDPRFSIGITASLQYLPLVWVV